MRAFECLTLPAASIFILIFGTYAYFYQAGGWNSNSRFDLVRAIVEEGTLRIDSTHHNTGDKACRNGSDLCRKGDPSPDDHYYSDKAPGTSWLAVPVYAVLHTGWLSDAPTEAELDNAAYATTLWSSALPGAFGSVVLYWLAASMGIGGAVAAWIGVAYGLGTLAFPYSTLLYGHQLMAVSIFCAFAFLAMARQAGKSLEPARLFGIGCLLGFSVVVEYPAALAVAVICGYAATLIRPVSQLAWIALGGGVMGIALAIYHTLAFGSPFTFPYEFSIQAHRHMGFMGLGAPDAKALAHILITPYRGLFFSSPWLLLAVPGAFFWVRALRRRSEVVVCCTITLVFVWLNAALVDWHGGYTLGARYLVPAIPFLAFLSAGVLLPIVPVTSRSRYRTAVIVLVVFSCGFMLVGTAVEPEAPKQIRSPYTEYLGPAFARGELSINTQSIDSYVRPMDGRRVAWNLGQKMGLTGLVSLLPLGIFVGSCSGWLAWTLRKQDDRNGSP